MYQRWRNSRGRPYNAPAAFIAKRALIFATILLLCQLANPLWAQKSADQKEGPPNPPYPGDSHIKFEWEYTCPENRACSFTCAGSGGGNKVTKLKVYLGSVVLENDQPSAAIFYEFSTTYFPSNNGFAVSARIGVLGCQVNGMRVDYSGPPRQ